VASFCEHGNESSSSVKGGRSLDQMRDRHIPNDPEPWGFSVIFYVFGLASVRVTTSQLSFCCLTRRSYMMSFFLKKNVDLLSN
jgi:hypothetical protein